MIFRRFTAKASRGAGEFWRYLLASAVALGVDFALLFLLTEMAGIHYLSSAAISYCAGAGVHYLLSIRLVFQHRSLTDQRVEFVSFVVLGVLGLVLNQAMLKLAVDGLGINYMIGKVGASGASFVVNFVARKFLLFRAVPARL